MLKPPTPRTTLRSVRALALVNNEISVRLLEATLRQDGVPLDKTALVLMTKMHVPWAAECAATVSATAALDGTLRRVAQAGRFYWDAASAVRRILRGVNLKEIYLVNNDNLLTSHVLQWAERHPHVRVTVVAEGLMNYQEITVKNRAPWRWRIKPLVAPPLRLSWRLPAGHLSGAFERPVARVASFIGDGLKAPEGKTLLVPLEPVRPIVSPSPAAGLVIHTGLWQWMTEEAYRPLAVAFAQFVKSQNFSRLYVKAHPRVPTGLLENLLPGAEKIPAEPPLESIANRIPAATVIGTCCSGLVTLKLLRPDLKCVDFGADYYCRHAYYSDRSVEALLRATGVEQAQSGLVLASTERRPTFAEAYA